MDDACHTVGQDWLMRLSQENKGGKCHIECSATNARRSQELVEAQQNIAGKHHIKCGKFRRQR